jgi:hypothetical protein
MSSVGKPDSQYAVIHTPNTVKSIFIAAMADIFRYDTMRIEKSTLSQGKRNVMLNQVFFILLIVPFEVDFSHSFTIPILCNNSNIKVWLAIGS